MIDEALRKQHFQATLSQIYKGFLKTMKAHLQTVKASNTKNSLIPADYPQFILNDRFNSIIAN